jgi:adenosylmethionine-8-amino-7-oxononanoate aminotransferase
MTREFNVHLIADEIAVGCGRTGTFFAWEQCLDGTPLASAGPPQAGDAPVGGSSGTRERGGSQVWPDFVLLSKGITGGTLPLSLVLTTEAIYRAFWSEDVTRGFLHSHSYTGNALACAAANAVLDRFDAGQLERNAAQSKMLAAAFAPLAEDTRVEHLRQRGLILAFDVKNAPERFAEKFHLAARRHELLIRPIGHTVYLMPPYLIGPATASFLANAVMNTMNEVLADAA